MTVVGVQWAVSWEDKTANFNQVRRMLEGAAIPPGSLVVLPEMFSTGFSLRVDRTRQGEPPEGEEFLVALARETGSAVLGGVVGGRDGEGKPYNQAVAFAPDGRLLARYSKIHPFRFGDEALHYGAGDAVVTFEWGGFQIAPFVCYDLRFPEIFRSAVDQGATLFAVIAQWPLGRARHWSTLLRARAIENQSAVVGVNRCGTDPQLEYPGRTAIVDPQGNTLAEGDDTPRLVQAVLEPGAVAEWRASFPALRDRRWPV
ncbi:MAG: carbon-nitrogen family hydrolase [Verrucomicrobiae bacterium]|nr:carbon-nitrogen family hydrolase [Verrucomicrobiae bacterium]